MPPRKLKLQAHLYLGKKMSHFSSTGWSWGCSFSLGRGLRPPGFTQLCTQHPLTWWIDLEQVEGVLVFLLHIRVLVWKKFPSETMISGSRSSLLTHFQKASLSWCCNLRMRSAARSPADSRGFSGSNVTVLGWEDRTSCSRGTSGSCGIGGVVLST